MIDLVINQCGLYLGIHQSEYICKILSMIFKFNRSGLFFKRGEDFDGLRKIKRSNIFLHRDEPYDVLAVGDWNQTLSFYQLSGKQVSILTQFLFFMLTQSKI